MAVSMLVSNTMPSLAVSGSMLLSLFLLEVVFASSSHSSPSPILVLSSPLLDIAPGLVLSTTERPTQRQIRITVEVTGGLVFACYDAPEKRTRHHARPWRMVKIDVN